MSIHNYMNVYFKANFLAPPTVPAFDKVEKLARLPFL
jgi:hypothetical protein